MSPYRIPSDRSDALPWRVTWLQRLAVKVRRYFGLRPYDAWSKYAREYRRYEKALARWERDHGPTYQTHALADGGSLSGWTRRPGKHPPMPVAPPVPVLE